MPAPTGNAVEDAIYAGWLYAQVYAPPGIGLFMTKDFGQNWTAIQTGTLPPDAGFNQAIPTNDVANNANYLLTLADPRVNRYMTLTVAPTNPNIIYVGSFGDTVNMVAGAYDFQGSDSGLIRIDTTGISDAHNLAATIYVRSDGGAVTLTAVGFATIDTNQLTQDGSFKPNDFLDPIAKLPS